MVLHMIAMAKEDGDPVRIDLAVRRLDIEVDPAVLSARRVNRPPMPARVTRGYPKHYLEHVTPASEGAVMPR